MVQEFRCHREALVPFTLEEDCSDFTALVQRLALYAKGVGLPDGFVAHQSFWCVDADSRVVGAANFRPQLNRQLLRSGGHIGYGVMPSERGKGYASKILSETLIKAKTQGLEKVLLSCKKNNFASVRVIEKNAGVFHSEASLFEGGDIVQRYWVRL